MPPDKAAPHTSPLAPPSAVGASGRQGGGGGGAEGEQAPVCSPGRGTDCSTDRRSDLPLCLSKRSKVEPSPGALCGL